MAVNNLAPFNIDPSTPDAEKWALVNQNFQALGGALNPFQISDGSNNILLIGKDSAGANVVKISKPGFDAYNAASSNLIFNSSQDTFKIVQSGTTSITPPATFVPGGAGKQRVTIAHNLGFKPATLVYVDNPTVGGSSDSGDGLGLVPNTLFLINSYYTVIESHAHVDTTNLYIDLIFLNQAGTNLGGANAYTWNYKYYILQETAN